ncbi:LPXTG cell wall anchor domain-containing protein [Streptomyces sannanensis]
MRTFVSLSAATAAAFALLTPAAYATPRGDNGTVKIHDAKTGEELRKNEPHVCTFYLDAFGFDGGQQVGWKIVEMPPTGTKGTEAKNGSLSLDAEGHGRSEDMNLPDGHYKLIWNFDGEHGKAKHKVFWTECEDEKPGENPGGQPGDKPSENPGDKPGDKPGENPGDKPGENPGDKPGDKPSEQPGDKPSPEPSQPAANGGSTGGDDTKPDNQPSPAGEKGTEGDLAETGSSTPVVALSAAAAALLGLGGFLVMRRRKAQQH